MGFSRQEYWSGLLFPSPGDLPDSGIKPRSPALQADSSPSEPSRKSIAEIICVHAFCYGGLVTKTCPTLATPWIVAGQAPLSMEFSRQEYRGGLPFPSPGDLPDPEIKPESPALQADSLSSEQPGTILKGPGKVRLLRKRSWWRAETGNA